ncbi:MAG: hypothetical protein ISS15_21050 [Alphaproteobacteria bacterium]|nr:hypothetical protein [Alphaproteobacteria bacterium]MBL7100154.1 hypothetical protein [Alphaproteobacteria bacterium]
MKGPARRGAQVGQSGLRELNEKDGDAAMRERGVARIGGNESAATFALLEKQRWQRAGIGDRCERNELAVAGPARRAIDVGAVSGGQRLRVAKDGSRDPRGKVIVVARRAKFAIGNMHRKEQRQNCHEHRGACAEDVLRARRQRRVICRLHDTQT